MHQAESLDQGLPGNQRERRDDTSPGGPMRLSLACVYQIPIEGGNKPAANLAVTANKIFARRSLPELIIGPKRANAPPPQLRLPLVRN